MGFASSRAMPRTLGPVAAVRLGPRFGPGPTAALPERLRGRDKAGWRPVR